MYLFPKFSEAIHRILIYSIAQKRIFLLYILSLSGKGSPSLGVRKTQLARAMIKKSGTSKVYLIQCIMDNRIILFNMEYTWAFDGILAEYLCHYGFQFIYASHWYEFLWKNLQFFVKLSFRMVIYYPPSSFAKNRFDLQLEYTLLHCDGFKM